MIYNINIIILVSVKQYMFCVILCVQVDREYAVQEVLYSVGFPVPHPVIYCSDTRVIGTEFYIMEHVQVLVASGSYLD